MYLYSAMKALGIDAGKSEEFLNILDKLWDAGITHTDFKTLGSLLAGLRTEKISLTGFLRKHKINDALYTLSHYKELNANLRILKK